jgi:hypothetical protein
LRLAEITAVTDLYTWKVLRRDLRLSRRDTERAILELATRAVAGADDLVGDGKDAGCRPATSRGDRRTK